MKKSSKYLNLALLRILPTVILIVLLILSTVNLFKINNEFKVMHFGSFVESITSVLSFILLGFCAIFKFFPKLEKTAHIFKILAGICALVYMCTPMFVNLVGIIYYQINQTVPVFSNYHYFAGITSVFNIMIYVSLAICCFLREESMKTRRTLTAFVIISFVVILLYSEIYMLVNFSFYTLNVKSLIISLIRYCSIGAIMVTALCLNKSDNTLVTETTE